VVKSICFLPQTDMSVKIEKLISGLCSISDEDFTCNNVYDFLGENPIDVDTISPFFFWSDNFYTRNLIYKDERFEMMGTRTGFADS
jgi:hypothetical protein